MQTVPGGVCDVLSERAPTGNVEDLETATDAQEWNVERERALDCGDLELISIGVDALRDGQALLPVLARIDVSSTDEQHAIYEAKESI
jgi:hypothetical protein